jgi:hypothetical protein
MPKGETKMAIATMIDSDLLMLAKFSPSLSGDRRTQVRYRPKVITYAAVGPSYHMVGRILNISKKGLSFTYFDFDDEDLKEGEYTVSRKMDIYTVDNFLKLRGIDCTITHKGIYLQKDFIRFAWMIPPPRRCSIRFEAMNPGQENKLLDFIFAHTVMDS